MAESIIQIKQREERNILEILRDYIITTQYKHNLDKFKKEAEFLTENGDRKLLEVIDVKAANNEKTEDNNTVSTPILKEMVKIKIKKPKPNYSNSRTIENGTAKKLGRFVIDLPK